MAKKEKNELDRANEAYLDIDFNDVSNEVNDRGEPKHFRFDQHKDYTNTANSMYSYHPEEIVNVADLGASNNKRKSHFKKLN